MSNEIFGIQGNDFFLNGKPFRVLAGTMHYFRVHPEYWRDRMRKMKAMGLNTLETYVAWNLHEPEPGTFVFDGWMDLARYIEMAGEEGLKVIVRPGPYICSEWEFGGLPSWLLKDPAMKLRCNYSPYVEAVDRFFSELLAWLAPLQISKGGPVIAMQIENEYGSYGNDKAYLRRLEAIMRAHGITVLLFTSDGATDEMLQYGTLPHILKTVNFGSRADDSFRKLREYQAEGPLMCTEFWNGWFDHWGEPHHTRSAQDAAAELDKMLSMGASVCFYMFHGGTNFGFMNGANYGTNYQPTITSYDDDAPLDEQGNVTPKYEAFRQVLCKYADVACTVLPAPAPTMAIAPFALAESVGMMSSIEGMAIPVESATPQPMEALGQSYGFIAYETRITGPRGAAPLSIRELHDRAHVFVDGTLVGIMERECPKEPITLAIPPEGIVLTILIENMGRVNYGTHLADRKGITDCVMLGQQILFGWTIYPLPLNDVSGLKFEPGVSARTPAFYRGSFDVDLPRDSFFLPAGWTKGVCWINGFNIGRYWRRGPQQTLYVPKPLFRQGRNEIILLELDGHDGCTVEFRSSPVLDQTQDGKSI